MSIHEGAGSVLDPRYIAARRVLLNALTALKPHGRAVIVVGAQAVYLQTGLGDIAVAPYTTDGDLALDPSLLGDEPQLEETMRASGFELLTQKDDRPQPGIWATSVDVGSGSLIVPIDLIVPEGAAIGGGRRAARLGPHLRYIEELFGHRGAKGVAMAQRGLRLAVPEDQVGTLCVSFAERVIAAARSGSNET